MNRLLAAGFIALLPLAAHAAIVDSDLRALTQPESLRQGRAPTTLSIIVFLNDSASKASLAQTLATHSDIRVHELDFMPALLVTLPSHSTVIETLSTHPDVAQLSLNRIGQEELLVDAESMLLRPSTLTPSINNWWQHGYTGTSGVLGLIDSGVATEHPGLAGKTIEIRQESGSLYSEFKNGVRTPHGTGVACIVAGVGDGVFQEEKGIAFGTTKIVAGIAGEEEDTNPVDASLQSLSTLDWMLTRSSKQPTVINYSFGNGPVACPSCPDWSGIAKVVDYVVNTKKILWAKSAGNEGWIAPVGSAPFASTMTIPADNYNGLTVANVNIFGSPDRNAVIIHTTSSRGPTLSGRRKPDLAAPGHNTRTCAPDPSVYGFQYTPAMDEHDGYRLMGGTSSAAPHVTGAILLLQDAGITDPKAQKALLINSADAWTDNGNPSTGHHPVMGSHWNRSYGWGYINMDVAYEQRNNIRFDSVSTEQPVKEFRTYLPAGGKVTLVHERRVGYNTADHSPWKLSPLVLEILDTDRTGILAQDKSAIDTVHQVSNNKPLARNVIIRVRLAADHIEGSSDEPFALVSTNPID